MKTLPDQDEPAVNFSPVSATVVDLVAPPAPARNSKTARLNSTEKTAFKVHARLVGYKIEWDPKTSGITCRLPKLRDQRLRQKTIPATGS